MKIKCLKRNFIVCGPLVVGEFTFSFMDVEFVAVGKATCNPEDTFNITIGRTVAYKKAKLKAINRFRTYIKLVEKDLTKMIQEAIEAHQYFDRETTEITTYLDYPTI